MFKKYEWIIAGLTGISIGVSFMISCLYIKKKLFNKSRQNQSNQFKQQNKDYRELKNQQLARVNKFFGDQKFKQMQNSYVIVFGVGGVGSHVVNMLARSGVCRIRIIDFDRVSLSSLNRHSFALRDDVGTSKVQCIKKYVKRILPHIIVQTVELYVTVNNVKIVLDKKADYIVDCIDNLDAKCELIISCLEMNLPLISSGGAGMKSDPTRLQIRDISDYKYDNMIMRLKRQLHKKGIKKGVKVVYSYQQTEKQLLPLTNAQQKQPNTFKVFDNYRIRIVPVLGTMPAIIGMTIASYILCELADQSYQPFETDYVKSNALNKVYNQLLNDERKKGVHIQHMPIDMEEVSIIVKEVYKWKCLITNQKEHAPRLVRWDVNKNLAIDNLVLLGKQNYQRHKQAKSLEELEYSAQIIARFQERAKKSAALFYSNFVMYI